MRIECEWIGFITPGLPAAAVAINDSCGQVISYANGLYAARLFAAIQSLAPVYKDVRATMEEANKTIPVQCDVHYSNQQSYYQVMQDRSHWHWDIKLLSEF